MTPKNAIQFVELDLSHTKQEFILNVPFHSNNGGFFMRISKPASFIQFLSKHFIAQLGDYTCQEVIYSTEKATHNNHTVAISIFDPGKLFQRIQIYIYRPPVLLIKGLLHFNEIAHPLRPAAITFKPELITITNI